MLKAEIKKEIMITNKEIAEFLYKDGDILDHIDELLEDMLYNEYKMDYVTRVEAVGALTTEDYIEILQNMARKLEKG